MGRGGGADAGGRRSARRQSPTDLDPQRFIAPESSTIAGEDAFRFHHTLVLEAAYRGVPKERRPDLHQRFAARIETRSGDRLVENEELGATTSSRHIGTD